jgi:hypothetical protein
MDDTPEAAETLQSRPDQRSLLEEMSALEQALGLRKGFIAALPSDDDWSFIIKAHALLEAAVSQLLAHELGRTELIDVFSRLDMAASGYGKLTFGKALGILEDPTPRYIRALREIRNDFVHQVSNADARLSEYLRKRPTSDLKAKHRALDLLFGDHKGPIEGILPEKPLTALDLFLTIPKKVMSGSLGIVLVRLHTRIVSAHWRFAAERYTSGTLFRVII